MKRAIVKEHNEFRGLKNDELTILMHSIVCTRITNLNSIIRMKIFLIKKMPVNQYMFTSSNDLLKQNRK